MGFAIMLRRNLVTSKVLGCAATLLFIFGTRTTSIAEVRVDLDLRAENVNGVTTYRGYAYPEFFPGGQQLDFASGEIVSQDGQYRVHTEYGGWTFDPPPAFVDFNQFVTSLDQAWYFNIDQGLPTERHYQMTPNLGLLTAADIAPPVILSPIHNSNVSTPTPHFVLDLPPGQSFTAQMGDPLHNVLSTVIPAGTTDWSPSVPLVVGKSYILNIYNSSVRLDDMGFNVPVDSEGHPLLGWASSGRPDVEGIVRFVAVVPEPATLALVVPGAALLLLQRRRHQKMLERPVR